MSTTPFRFHLVVLVDDHNRGVLVSQHVFATDAEDDARKLAQQNIGSVYAVMKVEKSFVANRPTAREIYLEYPPQPSPEAEPERADG